MSNPIPLFEISWDERDIVNAVRSIGRGSYWAKGPFVDRFESKLADYFGVEHAITVNSGTTALVATLQASDIGSGDEVIVPSMTFIATANAVRLVGAEPVFADIETESYGLDPDSVRKQITKRTAGIVPVHLYGGPCRIEELTEIAFENDLVLIEDTAESFGATYDGQYCGTFGDAGILSFCQNKVVVTGEGGAILTDDDAIAENVRLYRSHGRAEGDYFDSVESGSYLALGTNIRMSDLTAAVGCAQLEKADELIGGRRAAARYMNERFANVDEIRTPEPVDGGTHVYQLYTVRFGDDNDRRAVVEQLEGNDISSKIYWDTPVHRTEYYRESTDRSPDLPKTDAVADSVLSLPMYPDLSPRQADRIVDAVRAGIDQS